MSPSWVVNDMMFLISFINIEAVMLASIKLNALCCDEGIASFAFPFLCYALAQLFSLPLHISAAEVWAEGCFPGMNLFKQMFISLIYQLFIHPAPK